MMPDLPNPTFLIEPNPLSFGQVPQADIRVRVLRMTNLLGEGVSVWIDAKSLEDVPAGQPPSGFFWGALRTEIAFTGAVDFAVEFTPRAEGAFADTITVHIEPPGLVDNDNVEIELSGRGLPAPFEPL